MDRRVRLTYSHPPWREDRPGYRKRGRGCTKVKGAVVQKAGRKGEN